MRGIQLSLNKHQNLRLDRALEQLESLSSKENFDASITVADDISVNNEDAFLKGHGTTEMDGRLVAAICGVVERMNKLVYVRALRARYKPEIGDIIVGRVIEVAPKRWRLEINFNQDTVLMLSSMNLPDGIQLSRDIHVQFLQIIGCDPTTPFRWASFMVTSLMISDPAPLAFRDDELQLMNSLCAVFLKRMMFSVLKFVASSMTAAYTYKQEARSLESSRVVSYFLFPLV